jgi:hypothetical protein
MDSFFSGEVTQLFSDIYCGVELCKIPFNVATDRFVITTAAVTYFKNIVKLKLFRKLPFHKKHRQL